MVEILDDLVGGRFKIAEIDEQANIIQLLTACVDLDLVVVAVQVLALSLVPTQLVRRREVALDHDLVERRHTRIIPRYRNPD